MRFLIDASSDARIASHLRHLGHNATRVGTDYPTDLPDTQVLELAHSEQRILITDDHDFGGLVFRMRQPHAGVIYLRLNTTRLAVRLARVDYVLAHYRNELNRFIVVTRHDVRVRDREP